MGTNYDTTTRFNVDISDLKSAMNEAKRVVALANSEFKATSSTMDDWSKNADGISAKLKQLKTTLSAQQSVLDEYKKILEKVKAEYGENSKEAQAWQTKLNNQQAQVNKTEKEIKSLDSGIKELTEDTKESGDGFTVFKGVLVNLATDGIRLAVDGVKKLGSAMVDMVKESISAYSESEQLVGGVETLFKDSADVVLNYANNAYKTAGLSANQYMETVTSFSASLLQSLEGDTAKSAEVADMAITDMADNANKMGTDISSIQNAYQGFAKQNYTMLDNLKLGYGGTKSEMERLLADATEITGIEYSIDSLSDVYNAIHVIQTELDITGTTSKEASTTIQGSASAMKSAWQNLLVGISSDTADFGGLVDNFVSSVSTMLTNVMPRIISAIGGIGQLFSTLAPILADQVPVLIESVLPALLNSLSILIQSLLSSIIASLPSFMSTVVSILFEIVNAIVDNLPMFIGALTTIISQLLVALSNAIPEILMAIVEIVPQIIAALLDQLPVFIQACLDFLLGMVQAIPKLIDALLDALPQIITTIINALITAIPQLIDGAIKLLMAIVEAIPVIIESLIDALPEIITTIITGLITAIPQLIEGAIKLFMAILEALPVIILALIENLPKIIETIVTTLIENIPAIIEGAVQLFMAIIEAFPQIISALKKNLPQIINAIKDGLMNGFSTIKDVGKNLIEGLWNGIKDMTSWIKDKIKGFGSSVVDGLKDFFGIHSPSKLMEEEIGKFLPEGIAVGIDKNAKSVMSAMKDLTMSTVGSARSGLTGEVSGGIGGVVNNFTQINNSPKALSRLEIYRQSKNLLGYAGGV